MSRKQARRAVESQASKIQSPSNAARIPEHMTIKNVQLSSWGRYPSLPCELERPERYSQFTPGTYPNIARGQGRSYGDAALNENGHVVLTERLNRLRELDLEQGILRAEAGLTLDELLELIVPQGWFLPVTPGTRYVSLGGAVAADVHGKNHHCDGSIGRHVTVIRLRHPNGGESVCSPEEHADLFWATVGGMGLTGFIGEIGLRLMRIPSAYIHARHHAAANLEQLFELFTDAAYDAPYSVAWIDCLKRGGKLGRGVLMRGHHADLDELPADLRKAPLTLKPARSARIPIDMPPWLLNPFSIGLFNQLYYAVQAGKRTPFITDYRSFFYPLDGLQNWNRMYGRRGFLQYQCVIPEARAYEGMHSIIEKLAASRHASFLAVLKRMGQAGQGMLSFPMAGYTLALDLTLRDNCLLDLLNELDELVVAHGGRVYLAKDACLRPDTFRAMYPRYGEWLEVRHRVDPEGFLSSSLSRRLRIGEA